MILVGNGNVITRNKDWPYIENGAVVTHGDKVLETGPCSVLREKFPEAEFVDAGGGIIMPGLINMHSHIYSAMTIGFSMEGKHPRNYAESLNGTWWSSDRKLSPEGIKACAYAVFLDCIRNGVTTIFENHASFAAVPGSIFAIKDTAEDLGIRVCLCYELSDGNGSEKYEEYLTENLELADWSAKHGEGMISAMMGAHSLHTISDDILGRIASAGDRISGYHIHMSNNGREAKECLNTYGCRPVDRLIYTGILGEKTILANYNHAHSSELELIRDADAVAVNNPETNIYYPEGCSAVRKMMHNGILVGMGTDTYAHDMLESLKTFNVIQRYESGDQIRAFTEGMTMLLENNSRIASRFFSKQIGTLEPGAAADIIVMDYKPYTPFSDDNVNNHMLYGVNGRCCTTTIINGKLIYDNRKFVAFDEDEIIEKILNQSRKFWIRMGSRDYL